MKRLIFILAAISLTAGFGAAADWTIPRQKELLEEFEAISRKDSGRHTPRAKGWMDKVRELFES